MASPAKVADFFSSTRSRPYNLRASSIVIQGRVDGNLYGLERVELKRSATVAGNIYTPRITIEDGVSLKGSVLVQKDIPALQRKKADKTAASK